MNQLTCLDSRTSSPYWMTFIVVCMWMLHGSVSAQGDIAIDSAHYTLEKLLQVAQERNPEILAQKQSLESTLQLRDSAQTLFMPTWTIKGVVEDPDVNKTNSSTAAATLSMSQTLYSGGELSSQQRQADLSYEQAQHAMKRTRQTVSYKIKQGWFNLLEANALLHEVDDAFQRLKTHAHHTELFYKEGKVWRNDVLQAGVKVAQGEKDIIAARNTALRGVASLNSLLDRDIDLDIVAEGKLEWQEYPFDWSTLRERAVAEHPDILYADYTAKLAREEVREIAGERLPSVTLAGQYQNKHNLKTGQETKDDLSLTLTASWDFWDGGANDRDKASARADWQEALHSLQQQHQEVLLAGKNAFLTYQEAGDKVRVLRKSLEHAQENYRVNTVRYQEQLGTANDLLNAQALLTDTRKDWISALASYERAVVSLEYALGVDLEHR